MAADDPSGARPSPVVLRIKLRYDDVDAMVQRFAPNVGKSGIFLPTKSLQPVGTEIKFELRLANDQPVLVGLGRVKAVKEPDPANPRAAFGLAIELMRVTRESREVIMKMLERRKVLGLPDVAIPMPDNLEAAKRADVETQPRAQAYAVPTEMLRADSEPILQAAPIKVEAPPAPEPAPSFTAPRPARSTILPSADRPSAPMLAPEPLRPKRMPLADVLAQAREAGPSLAAVTVPGLDENVDVEHAMMRARALASATDLDAELAALREEAAAPLAEISIEAASAELARQLGGAPVKRRPRAEVVALGTAEVSTVAPAAPPRALEPPAPMLTPMNTLLGPAISSRAPAPAPIAEPVAEVFVAPESANTEPSVEPEPEPEPLHAHARPATSSAELDNLAAEMAAQIVAGHGGGAIAVERADEPPPPGSTAFLSASTIVHTVEPIELDVEPAPEHEDPADVVELATPVRERRGTAPPAMIVDDDAELMSFERALDAARVGTGVSHLAAPAPTFTLDDEPIPVAEDELEEVLGESTQIGQHPDPRVGAARAAPVAPAQLAESLDRQLDEAEEDAESDLAKSIRVAAHAYEAELAEVPEAQPDFEEEEVSDFDVLAEADAEDADLLSANGEAESQDSAPKYVPPVGFGEQYAHEHPDASASATISSNEIATMAAAFGAEADPSGYGARAFIDPPNVVSAAYVDPEPGEYAPEPSSDHASAFAYEPEPEPEPPPAPAVSRPFGHLLKPVTSIGHEPAPTSPKPHIPRRAATPDFDFASQLDLDDEEGEGESDEGEMRPPLPPETDEFDGPSEYTLAEALPQQSVSFATSGIPETPGLDAALEFDEPHQFATQTPAPPSPRRSPSRGRPLEDLEHYQPPQVALDFDEPHGFAEREVPNDDLESALSALDVDLDSLEIPREGAGSRHPRAQRATERPGNTGTGSRPLPGMPPERGPNDPPTVRPTGEREALPKGDKPDRPNRTPKRRPVAGRSTSPAPAALRPTHPRASSDDGVMIDFDDDDDDD